MFANGREANGEGQEATVGYKVDLVPNVLP